MKNVRAVIYCLLSLVLSVFCIQRIIYARNFEPSLKLHVTDNEVISNIINMAIKFSDHVFDKMDFIQYGDLYSWLFVGIGTTALLFFVFFSDSMHEFFSKLPLGSIRKIDYFKKSKSKIGKVALLLSPSFIIGLYTWIHSMLYHLLPEKLDFCVKWILPATIILVSIAFLALIISVLLDGGLWGIIVRAPLVFITNLCFSLIMGALFLVGIIAISALAISLLAIVAIIAMFIAPTKTTKTEIYHR